MNAFLLPQNSSVGGGLRAASAAFYEQRSRVLLSQPQGFLSESKNQYISHVAARTKQQGVSSTNFSRVFRLINND
jgi:hypothetical protein